MFFFLGGRSTKMSGTTGLTIDASGHITSAKKLAGSTGLAVNATGRLSRTRKISGSTSLTITGVGTAVASSHRITGTTGLTITAAGNLTKFRKLAGTTSLSLTSAGSLSSIKRITGSTGLTIAVTGAVVRKRLLVGATGLTITSAASLKAARRLTGNVGLSITANPAPLKSLRKLTGSTSLTITPAGRMYQPQFLIYHNSSIIRQVSSNVRQLDLYNLLAQGMWQLGMSYIDQYDNESSQATIDVEFDADGHVLTQLREIDSVVAEPLAGGMVYLSITLIDPQAWHRTPSSFEIYDTASQQIISTVTAAGNGAYTTDTTLGAFAHGLTMRLQVRPVDANGHGVWSVVPSVVVDSVGPVSPVVVG